MIPGAAGAGAAMAKQSRWWTILPVCATELQSQPGNELSGDLTNTACGKCGMVLCSTTICICENIFHFHDTKEVAYKYV